MLSKRHSEDGRSGIKEIYKIEKLRDVSPVEFMLSYGVSLQSVITSACKTVAEAYCMQESVTLAVIKEAYGEELAHSFVKAQLIGVNDFVGARNKMSDEQLDALAMQILHERFYLNQYELILFCGRLRSGKYRDFYGSVDPMLILDSMSDFCSERMDDIDRFEREQKRMAEEEKEKNTKKYTFDEFRKAFPEKAKMIM